MGRVVVVGAGIVGTACALDLARAGCEVVVIERAAVGAGTTSRGEGNILVSDKGPGAELDLALASRALWCELADELGADTLELEPKGGLVVAATPDALAALQRFADSQRRAGVEAAAVADPLTLEPRLAPGLAGAVHYPQDMQCQPVLASAAMLTAARDHGATLVTGEVVGALTGPSGQLTGVRLASGETIGADAVVNAAGTWGATLGERLGAPVPVLPRRGFVLVTEPVGPLVRHKVYSADYVANVAASGSGLETSCVVESTRGGTVLIGASRERVGFDTTLDVDVVRRLAAQAVALVPALRSIQLLRVYRGFRPYCPDHLPVIGPDPRLPGLLHACGHEGAGVALAPGTARLIRDYVMDSAAAGALERYASLLPDRFARQEGS